jgi:carbonic anhydrase
VVVVSETLTPAEAWQTLRDGNERFVAGTSIHPNQNAARRSELVATQNPFCVIFGCSDSRLAAEIIFDLGLGDAFVVRSAGQVIDDAVLGSLEYAIEPLGVPLIVILGHDSCGAVTASVNAFSSGTMPQGFVRDLVERIMPSVIAAQRNGVTTVDETVVEHVKQTGDRLLETSQIIARAVEEGRTAVLGVCYHLDEGKAELVSGLGNV